MTKVSWRRILQRAGNDLPLDSPLPLSHPKSLSLALRRAAHASDNTTIRPGELENELRRALRHVRQDPPPGQRHADRNAPVPVRQPHRKPRSAPSPKTQAVPAPKTQAVPAPRRGGAIRNMLAISLSAAIIAIAVQQIGQQWRSPGGGGGSGGGQRAQGETQPVQVALKPKEQSKLFQTGYAIQPLVNPGEVKDIETHAGPPAVVADEKPAARDAGATEVAAFRLDIEEAAKLFQDSQTPSRPAQPALAPAPKIAPIPEAEEKRLMARAHDMMRSGDVTGARLLFEHLANRESATAAFALAQSFDAGYLKTIQVRGLSPDQERADYWYRRAGELICSAESSTLC